MRMKSTYVIKPPAAIAMEASATAASSCGLGTLLIDSCALQRKKHVGWVYENNNAASQQIAAVLAGSGA